MEDIFTCTLESLQDENCKITLTNEKVILGRNSVTKITHPKCSKNQICVKANLQKGYVLVKSRGLNKSALNGFILQTSRAYEAVDGDVIEFVQNDCFYRINMKRKSIKEEDEHSPPSKKFKTESNEPAETETKNSEGTWEEYGNGELYVFTSNNIKPSRKIASYDIDGTIIKTKSGNTFPKTIDDWQIAFNEVPAKLSFLHKEDYKIVFFTNQAGIGKGKLKIDDFKTKIHNILHRLNIPVQVFVSTGKGLYRKPMPGMWKKFEELNGGLPIEMFKSFFVGDAAGRPETTEPVKRKKDHSSSDRLFALNIGITFWTPEQHFQNAKSITWDKPLMFDPKNPIIGPNLFDVTDYEISEHTPEVIIMVGTPASGKSHFAREHFECNSYVIINRDKLGTWQKCVELLKTSLKKRQNVVIDNTNPDIESRKRYIDIAKKFRGCTVRCFLMDVPYTQARHNNLFRELTDKSHSKITDMVYNMYKSKYQQPTMEEGYKEIYNVSFVPKFKNDEEQKLYKTYLLDSY